MGDFLAPAFARVVKVYRFFSENLGQLFQRTFLLTAEKEHRIAVSDYRVGIVLVDSL